MKRYEGAIVDLTKLIDIELMNGAIIQTARSNYVAILYIEQNNKFALRYRGEAYYLTKRYKDTVIDLMKFEIAWNKMNANTLEELENSLKIKQDSALKFRVKFNFIMERYKEALQNCLILNQTANLH
ncbi:hypothetical protein C2G38_2195547 [Gigaspora rosea]|uniref:Uncharacterized protein n=1 Tax=Gigaspora rosea TaxID=44941 RepID=A0A397V4Q0_9GLOM|nr:hypothetical protein C2G38_2195547 [Gigaspora rosea]